MRQVIKTMLTKQINVSNYLRRWKAVMPRQQITINAKGHNSRLLMLMDNLVNRSVKRGFDSLRKFSLFKRQIESQKTYLKRIDELRQLSEQK